MSRLRYLILLVAAALPDPPGRAGVVVGGLARLSLPGPDPMTIPQTVMLGLAGNIIAGVIVWLVWGHGVPGLILSVVCSSVILYVMRCRRGGGLTRPAGPLR